MAPRHDKASVSQHLPIDRSNDGGAQAHAGDEADVKIPLEDERLYTGTNEKQSGVEEAVPGGGAGVVHKLDETPADHQVKRIALINQDGQLSSSRQSF